MKSMWQVGEGSRNMKSRGGAEPKHEIYAVGYGGARGGAGRADMKSMWPGRGGTEKHEIYVAR